MEQVQSSETVKTVTEEDQTRLVNPNEPIRSNQAESYRSTTQAAPVRSTTQVNTVQTNKSKSRNTTYSITRVIYWLLGVLEGLLAFRLVLKLLGANTSSSFFTFIYNVTRIFIAPFTGMFKPVEAGFETSTLVAMLVYALIGWGLAKLVAIITNSRSVNNLEI